jgi:hypothetical protein
MLHIRVVKTSSGTQAVQVVYYRRRKRVIYKHIGSACTDEELDKLKEVARDLIETHMPPFPAFQDTHTGNLLYLDKTEFMGVYYYWCPIKLNKGYKVGFGC